MYERIFRTNMIRSATLADTKAIASLTVAAMEDLAKQFCASAHAEDAVKLFEHFIALEDNQYSYTNTLVYLVNDEIAGSINAYDGRMIEKLRLPFFTYLKENFHPNGFEMELESEADEFYLDTISVSPTHQGQGIGKKLIQAAIERARELSHQKVGLLVDEDNPNAKRLYESLGFEHAGYKMLLGKKHEHLTCHLWGCQTPLSSR